MPSTSKASFNNNMWVRDMGGLAVTTNKPHGALLDLLNNIVVMGRRCLIRRVIHQGKVAKPNHLQTSPSCRGSTTDSRPHNLGQVT